MLRILKSAIPVAIALMCVAGIAIAAEEERHEERRPPAPRGEAHPAPKGYQRPAAPQGWDRRPAANFDRAGYQHNFQAARSFHIGPYHRPTGWASHHWAYGQVLPRVYWAPEYHIGDYWLFGLEVPPAGFEWVRDDDDAILVDVNNGQILQVEYGVFA